MRRAPRVVMLLENNPFPDDVRVRREAEALVCAGYHVTVVAPRGPGQRSRETCGGVRVRRFVLPRLADTRAGIALEYLLANLWLHYHALVEILAGATVVHLHNPPDTLFPAGLLARLLRRRVVFDHHDLAPELYAAKFGGRWPTVLLRVCERASMRIADLVFAANDSHRELALGRGGVPPERVVVVRNGPPEASVGAGPPARGGVLLDPHIVFLGEMGAQDGVEALPAVLAALRDRHGLRPHLTVVGDGPRRANVAQAVCAAGFDGAVSWPGRVPVEEVPAHLARADICVDPAPPSRLNELSTMAKIAEYLAAGRPVVAHPLKETRRTAHTAMAPSAAPTPDGLADAIAALAHDPERRRMLAAAGLRRAAEITWEHSAAALVEAYARIVPADR